MLLPTQYIPIRSNRVKPVKRGEVMFEKSNTDPDSTKQVLNAHVVMYEQREGSDRRQRKMKPMLDTRTGRDRRFDKDRPSIDIKA